MITDLIHLKMILPVFAAAGAFFLFAFFRLIISLISAAVLKKSKNNPSSSDNGGFSIEEREEKYRKVFSREELNGTWHLSVAAAGCLILLSLSVLLNRKLAARIGVPLFVSLCLALTLSSVICIMRKRTWKENAFNDFIMYAGLLTGIGSGVHSGMRMMLSMNDAEIPLLPVFRSVQEDNPGLSGKDLLLYTGKAAGSVKIIEYADNLSDCPEYSVIPSLSGKNGVSRRAGMYAAVFQVMSFAVILGLCFIAGL